MSSGPTLIAPTATQNYPQHSRTQNGHAQPRDAHRIVGRHANSKDAGRSSAAMQPAATSGPTEAPAGPSKATSKPAVSSANHLLRFQSAGREASHKQSASRGQLTGNRGQRRGPFPSRPNKYDKNKFLAANFRFLVSDAVDAPAHHADPDRGWDWEDVLQVEILATAAVQCPISLDSPPFCPQITPCGHIFAFPSIMQHCLCSGDGLRRAAPCPLCFAPVVARELKSVLITPVTLPQVGKSLTFQLLRRGHTSITPMGQPLHLGAPQSSATETTPAPVKTPVVSSFGNHNRFAKFGTMGVEGALELWRASAQELAQHAMEVTAEGGLDAAAVAPAIYAAQDALAGRARRWAAHRAERLAFGTGGTIVPGAARVVVGGGAAVDSEAAGAAADAAVRQVFTAAVQATEPTTDPPPPLEEPFPSLPSASPPARTGLPTVKAATTASPAVRGSSPSMLRVSAPVWGSVAASAAANATASGIANAAASAAANATVSGIANAAANATVSSTANAAASGIASGVSSDIAADGSKKPQPQPPSGVKRLAPTMHSGNDSCGQLSSRDRSAVHSRVDSLGQLSSRGQSAVHSHVDSESQLSSGGRSRAALNEEGTADLEFGFQAAFSDCEAEGEEDSPGEEVLQQQEAAEGHAGVSPDEGATTLAKEGGSIPTEILPGSSPNTQTGVNFTSTTGDVHMYQSLDGQWIFLDPLCVKVLLSHYGSHEACPSTLTATVLELETMEQTEYMRKRCRFLAHLPLTGSFQFAEVALSGLLPLEALAPFADELAAREKRRRRRVAAERRATAAETSALRVAAHARRGPSAAELAAMPTLGGHSPGDLGGMGAAARALAAGPGPSLVDAEGEAAARELGFASAADLAEGMALQSSLDDLAAMRAGSASGTGAGVSFARMAKLGFAAAGPALGSSPPSSQSVGQPQPQGVWGAKLASSTARPVPQPWPGSSPSGATGAWRAGGAGSVATATASGSAGVSTVAPATGPQAPAAAATKKSSKGKGTLLFTSGAAGRRY